MTGYTVDGHDLITDTNAITTNVSVAVSFSWSRFKFGKNVGIVDCRISIFMDADYCHTRRRSDIARR